MTHILVTGSTGNIGFDLVKYLSKSEKPLNISAGVRDIENAKPLFAEFPNVTPVHFDFSDHRTFKAAIAGIDTLFLLRPPELADVDQYFRPLIEGLKQTTIKQIMFLSVQGAERSKVIPHNKIEKLILESGIDYIFLRPSYFMQNLSTTLLDNIRERREIILPAGNAKFNWIDTKNIAEAAARLTENFSEYRNQAFELTGYENKNFNEVTQLINAQLESPLSYRPVNPLKFFRIKKKQGLPKGKIIVMLLLHFLPRFQKAPRISDFYETLTGKQPTNLKEFIQREKAVFEKR